LIRGGQKWKKINHDYLGKGQLGSMVTV